ncbi:MAG: DNA translocase FtsK 4TM domain-containing protein [Cytophagales bacterium]
MAKNTFRKAESTENTVQEEKPEVLSNSRKKSKINPKLFQDPRFKLIFGLSLIFFSVFASFSLVSYIFTGAADQSLVESAFTIDLRDAGQEAENWLGLFGAIVAYYLVFKGFGIASLLFMPLFFIYGVKIVFLKELYPVRKLFNYVLFFGFWLSTTFGFLVLITEQEEGIGFLAGGIGYEIATIANEMIGLGTFLLLAFAFLSFIIFAFNITTFAKRAKEEFSDNVNEIEDELIEHDNESNEFEGDENFDDENIEDEPEEELEDDTWKIKSHELPKTNSKLDLELVVETPIVEEPTPKAEIAPFTRLEDIKTKEYVSELPPYDPTLDLSRYQYPTIDLLKDYGENKGAVVSKEELEENKNKIVQTLNDFSIGITSIKATIGPTVTLYEIVPDAGIKISKIANLSDDIALRLSALGVRIIAPMPGKGTIGMEVPNKNKQMVPARDVLMDDKFAKSTMELPIAFGRTITNEVFVADLATMPHLLMAGATGMGKSVGINMLLASLLYKKHPSQLKIVMVDPKKVELSVYNNIERHFLAKLPDGEEAIITDTKKVVHTLNSLCIEMDTRYSLLKDAGCRNLKEYNPKFISRRLNPNDGHRFLPYIVVVIDELADLMIVAGKEIEMPIARLAQLARAVGIHLVLATQRPSVNVITGLIKANFPARLSFRVTTKVDSKIILDEGGADQLVGKGDMLLKINSDMVRLQCAFVDTPEVENLVNFIGNQQGYPTAYQLPEYFDENADPSDRQVDLTNRDPKFEEAARLIVAFQQGSTSLIQRKLSLGYARSGRIMDQLEAAGIVGPPNGSKVRDVQAKDERSLQEIIDSL